MSLGQPDPKRMTPNDLKIQLGMMEKTIEFREVELYQRSQELERTYAELKRREEELVRRDTELKQQTSELTDLRIKLEVTKTKAELGQKKPTYNTRFLSFLVSIFFGAATLLFNLGNSMITATPPDTRGNTVLILAGIIYLAASVVTIYILGGDK